MPRELYCNNVETTLSSAVTTSGQTTFVVTSGLNFPKVGNFRILIGTEICIVTAVTINSFVPATWTVTRGVEGTTASTYSIGTRVNFVLTSQSVQNIFTTDRSATDTASTATTAISPPRTGDMFFPTDSMYTMVVYDGNAWRYLVNGQAMTPPQFNTSFNSKVWYSESPDAFFTLDTSRKVAFLYDPTPAYTTRSYYTAAPTTPYTFTIAMVPHTIVSGWNKVGLGWRSSTGQYAVFAAGSDNGNNFYYRYYRFTSASGTFAGDYFNTLVSPMLVHGPLAWMRIADNGTNRSVLVSSNGINWTTLHTISRTDSMTPDNIAVVLTDTGISTTPIGQTIVHMSLS